jgi:hypothetical protein
LIFPISLLLFQMCGDHGHTFLSCHFITTTDPESCAIS